MDFNRGGNGQQIVLSGETYKAITEILSDLVAKTKARMIIFADMNGHAITQKGNTSGLNVNTLAALSAGDFAATAEMARLVGENQKFKFIFHEGEQMNMYLCSVGDDFLLVIVFDISVALGMIRIYANRTIKALMEVLETAKEEEEKAAEFLDIEFSTLLSQELDKTFNS